MARNHVVGVHGLGAAGVSDYVQSTAERAAEFFRQYSHTDMRLEENILGKEEFRRAQAGKRHYRDADTALA